MQILTQSAPALTTTRAIRSKNLPLEALRGVAAAVVVWHHVIVHHHRLDPGYSPVGVGAYNAPGHFAVLLFFLLSGYVIGLANPAPLRRADVADYLRKRFLRLYPIYVVALLAGVAVAAAPVSLAVVAQHLLFLQGWTTPVLVENNPLWSLQYEVLFYLAFIPLSMRRVPPLWAAGVSALVGVALLLASPGSSSGEMSQYFIGFSFWSLGWALHTLPVRADSWSASKVVSALLLVLCVEPLNPLNTAAHKVAALLESAGVAAAATWEQYLVNPYDFAALPAATLIVLIMAGATSQWVRRGVAVLYALPLVGVLSVARHWGEPGVAEFALPCLFYFAAVALYVLPATVGQRAAHWMLSRLAPLGDYSYGVYVIHFPILVVFGSIAAGSGGSQTFLLRAVAYIALVGLAGWWLDKKFQPWVKPYAARLVR